VVAFDLVLKMEKIGTPKTRTFGECGSSGT